MEVRPPGVGSPPEAPNPSSRGSCRSAATSAGDAAPVRSVVPRGLSSGDFEPAFRGLLGAKAPLSPSDDPAPEGRLGSRLPRLAHASDPWRLRLLLGRRDLSRRGARGRALLPARRHRGPQGRRQGPARDGPRLPREHGVLGQRPSRPPGPWPGRAASRGRRRRLGLWAALSEVYPETRHQRCWNHRARNVIDQLPKRLWLEARRRLREVWWAPTREACEVRRDETARWLHAAGQDQAAETLYRDWKDFTTLYDCPAEHWLHLRTSNPIESVFAGVRLRTNVAKRARVRENALYLVFKIVERLRLALADPELRGHAHDPASERRPLPRWRLRAQAGGVSGLIVVRQSSVPEGRLHAS